jgi:dolichyl-phosphate-mannose--protein O-mannosyl transferase
LLKRPVAFYFEVTDNGYREILALGNPVTWWLGAAAVGYAVIRLIRCVGSRARAPELVIVVLAGMTYLPWLLLGGRREVAFLYYFLPAIPWLCLALGLSTQRLAEHGGAGRAIVLGFAAVSVAMFVYYQPLLTAHPLTYGAWKQRILFEHCAREDGELVPRVRLGRTEPRLGAGKPPAGWCWI